MAEEHRCEAPEGHILCVNNCGFFGSSATMNLCSKCYRDHCLNEQQQASIVASLSPPSPSSSSSSSTVDSQPRSFTTLPSEVRAPPPVVAAAPEQPQKQQQPNRCSTCRKRVGLTGFKCRCGITFCGVHRYPEKHGCEFDFKKVGREEIARSNPLVIAPKLDKI